MYVTIVDENDNAPMFQQPHYEILLDEGPATINASLITIQALDLDEDLTAQLPMPSLQATSSTPFVSTGIRSAAGGRVQEEGQLAKGTGGELSDIMWVGAEQRWVREETRGTASAAG